jgi:hypothetical protein
MIIGNDFVWLHLGKTGGKTSRKAISLVKDQSLKKVFKYPDHHFSIKRYEEVYGEDLSGKKILIGFRKLIQWMPSYYMQSFNNLDGYKDVAISGKVAKRNGSLIYPDEILKNYISELDIDSIHFIRCEYMYDDLLSFFKDSLNHKELKKICSVKIGKKNYKTPLLKKDEIEKIYNLNPVWQKIEKKIYGIN